MPRDLADVLHYFLPEAGNGPAARSPSPPRDDGPQPPALPSPPAPGASAGPGSAPTPPLPILGVPIGDRDVVRAALVWNLAVETARLGGDAVVLAPGVDAAAPLWPEPGIGPLGTELCLCGAEDLDGLYARASELAIAHARRLGPGGIVFVRLPPAWLEAPEAHLPFRWILLLSASRREELDETYALCRSLVAANPAVEIGVTIHGVRSVAEARTAFDRLHHASESGLGLSPFSYGLLVDDLHVYRAIAAQRPIGLVHPQAPATRALADVSRLLYEDARSRVLG